MPASPSSYCPTLPPLEHKWVDRLVSEDWRQHHILAMLLLNKEHEEACKTTVEEILPVLPKLTHSQMGPLALQLEALDSTYPGGLLAYLHRARKLLQDSKNEVNPFEDCVAVVPEGEMLETEKDKFVDLEEVGIQEAKRLAFVLVAGGLGERLGYPDIKIALPVELITGMTYMELYAAYILAYEETAEKSTNVAEGQAEEPAKEKKITEKKKVSIPLVIMTSDDTHEKTLKLFEKHAWFGLKKEQVTFLKQEKVAALADADARMAVKRVKTGAEEILEIVTKPHGHGDVHSLLLKHGVIDQWQSEGREWVVFFQDTNALMFRGLPAALGVSVRNSFAMNTMAVPRKPGDAMGAICKLRNTADGSTITVNVEYNVLEPLLRSNGGKGDEADPLTTNSRYPGNTNALIVNIPTYARVLRESQGVVPEFVNPKYADSSRTTFQSSARLECMMQELPKLMGPKDKVGFTQMDRFLCYSTVKNSMADAAKKTQAGSAGECAFTAEVDYYINNKEQLAMAHRWDFKHSNVKGGIIYLAQVGLSSPESQPTSYGGVMYKMSPKVVLHPSFGVTRKQIASRIQTVSQLVLTDRSSLFIKGDVELGGLDLDGSLVLKADPGAKLRTRTLILANDGVKFEEIKDPSTAKPHLAIRGYKLVKSQVTEYVAKATDKEVLMVEGEHDLREKK